MVGPWTEDPLMAVRFCLPPNWYRGPTDGHPAVDRERAGSIPVGTADRGQTGYPTRSSAWKAGERTVAGIRSIHGLLLLGLRGGQQVAFPKRRMWWDQRLITCRGVGGYPAVVNATLVALCECLA